MLLKIEEHFSTGYRARTEHNANSADVTIAVAADFTTAGERLTKSLATSRGKDRYIAFNVHECPVDASRKMYKLMKEFDYHSINIAGNGIYTMSDHGFTQEELNRWMYDFLKPLVEHVGLTHTVSGGQSGIDLAGGVASEVLGVKCTMTLPRHFKQRWEDGVDKPHRKFDIILQVEKYSKLLEDWVS